MSNSDRYFQEHHKLHPPLLQCAKCGDALQEPFGWCSNCEEALCLSCGRKHFCTPDCQRNGCFAGLCVRLAVDGKLSTEWGLPSDAAITVPRDS